jgi:diguanylate cyclase
LYTKHLVEPAEQVLMTARSGLLDLVDQVKKAVHDVDIDTSDFDARLTDFQRDLATATTVDDMGGQVRTMLAETKRVSEGIGKLSVQLDQSKSDVRRLTDELHRVREDAQIDALSGLLNRRGFDRELQRMSPKPGARDGALSVIMLDIDHFKKINDTYGHPLGDVVISVVGRLLRDCVGESGIAARYGGEEFAVLLPEQSLDAAQKLAEAIRDSVEHGQIRRRKGDTPIGGVTVSAGVAAWRTDEDVSSVVERADRALYVSKRAGRNRVTADGA